MNANELEHAITVLTRTWDYQEKMLDFTTNNGMLKVWSIIGGSAFHSLAIVPLFESKIKYITYNKIEKRCELHIS